MPQEQQSVYDMIGGESTITALVECFYSKIEQDENLATMFPDDLEPGKYWQKLFLMQYFGGPTQYAEERGHPRLRMRHMPFPIDQIAAQQWLQYMLEAIDEVEIQEPARSIMIEYFQRAAPFMVNSVKPE